MRINRIQAFACRAPIKAPVATAFGVMKDRPAVFLRLSDGEGCFGWGEVFANWPAAGAEHRVRLLEHDIAPLILGREVGEPAAFFHALSADVHLRALQCGEPGPFHQVIAGIDTALWDMRARRAGVALRHLLNPDAPSGVPAYASGIHIAQAGKKVRAARAKGFGAFKVKVGFDAEQDAAQVTELTASVAPGERLFADANQGFDANNARRFLGGLPPRALDWFEEPLPVDAAPADWAAVATHGGVALAGGENVSGMAGFEAMIASGQFQYIQPDVAKWGGVTGCFAVAQAALAAGRVYCPHFLGGGIGLAASAEVLAAAAGPGLLEVDVNPNPLRSAFEVGGLNGVGAWSCATDPGLGIATLPDALRETITLQIDLRARVDD